jgi:hypothetical protein
MRGRYLASCAMAATLAAMPGYGAATQVCAASTLQLLGSHLEVAQFAARDEKNPDGRLIASACKPRPSSPGGEVLAAVAYDDGREGEKRIAVAVVDAKRSRVVASHQRIVQEEPGLMLNEGSLWLDTANYQLAPGLRAFGVDLSGGGYPGCVEGGVGPMRTLYVLEGRTLRPVLQDFYVSQWSFAEGGPVCANNRQVIANTEFTIATASAASHGFADLAITARTRFDDPARKPPAPRRWTLRYDGQRYSTDVIERSMPLTFQ